MKVHPTRRDFLCATTAVAASASFWPEAGTSAAAKADGIVKVVVWDERQPTQKQAYDGFLGDRIAEHLRGQPGLSVKSVGLDDPGQGLNDDVLGDCRVLVWWGHVRQGEVAPEVGKRIVERIKAGTLSLVALHSAHWSTPFVEAMNARTLADVERRYPATDGTNREIRVIPPDKRYTTPKYTDRVTPYIQEHKFPDGRIVLDVHLPFCCFPAYRHDALPSQIRVLKPDHPIAQGLPSRFEVSQEEMYDEPFHVPEPDEVILEERFQGGEWFRSGALWKVGKGTVFYFRPGHETYPTYKQEMPLKVVTNAVTWLATS